MRNEYKASGEVSGTVQLSGAGPKRAHTRVLTQLWSGWFHESLRVCTTLAESVRGEAGGRERRAERVIGLLLSTTSLSSLYAFYSPYATYAKARHQGKLF